MAATVEQIVEVALEQLIDTLIYEYDLDTFDISIDFEENLVLLETELVKLSKEFVEQNK